MNDFYDKNDPSSIEKYAKNLIDMTFQDVIDQYPYYDEIRKDKVASFSNTKHKGGLGNLLEEFYFMYHVNSDSRPDFQEAGVELKVTPYEVNKKGEYRAGERLVLTMIDYNNPVIEDFYESHLWKKCETILLIVYFRDKTQDSNLLYPIHFVSLFSPPESDKEIIKSDYLKIIEKIKAGKANELSESDTFYLGACTKGATAESSLVPQFYAPSTLAKKRAFCYKNSYMTYILNEYLRKQDVESDKVIDKDEQNKVIKDNDLSELKKHSFGEIIISRINKYVGKTDKQLCELFGRDYNNNKSQWSELAFRMLGIKSNRAEEFRKSNITVKIIRIEENGRIRENMSFPPFKYRELVNETWEDSTLHNYFDETKFLFVVYKKIDGQYHLTGAQMWNMPYKDLNHTVRNGWDKIVETIKSGIQFTLKETQTGIKVTNNLPKKRDNEIIHIRPHANKSYYKFLDGTIIGTGKQSDANQLPDGTWMTNYSFWINNDYILKQLDSSMNSNTV
ncbi:MAG: restriction endonuclease [Clostridia bacterium]|nr:restriction endonuclease [Clostridia bacterium]